MRRFFGFLSTIHPGENMKIAIDKIKVDENMRIRKEVGDLQPLEDSIKKVGLLNPIVIDETGELLAGHRRLSACKNLGMDDVEVTVVDLAGDKIGRLEVELAENFHRKDFTPEEILASEERRREILESMREKSTWERCKLWLKNLFSAPPPDEQKIDEDQNSTIKPENKENEETNRTENAGTDGESSNLENREKTVIEESNNKAPLFHKEESAAADQHAIKWRSS